MEAKRPRISLRRRLLIALLTPVVFATVASAVAFYSLEREEQAARDMVSASMAQSQHQSMAAAVAEARAGERGYVLTGEPRFLESYQRAIEAFSDAVELLSAHNPEWGAQEHTDHDYHHEIQSLFERWRREVAGPVIDARARHPWELVELSGNALAEFFRAEEADSAAVREQALNRLTTLIARGVALADGGPTDAEWRAVQSALTASQGSLGAIGGSHQSALLTDLRDALTALVMATQQAERSIMSRVQQGESRVFLRRQRELLGAALAQHREEFNDHFATVQAVRMLGEFSLIGGVVGGVLFGLGISLVLLKSINSRLKRLSEAARDVADGDFEQRVPVDGDDELARVGGAFNSMAGDLRRRQRGDELLDRLGKTLQACHDLDEANAVAARFCERLFPGRAGSIYLISASRNLAELVASWGDRVGMVSNEVISPSDCWALREARVHHFRGEGADMPCAHLREPMPEESICFPLISQDETMGFLMLLTVNGDEDFMPNERTLGGAVAEQLNLALGNIKLRESLRQQSIRDPLTGLYNRRYLDETLERELHRANRAGSEIALIAVDLDHFKQLNDQYGHDAGDVVLKRIGAVLYEAVRASDIAARVGGEEFLLVLVNANAEQARQRAEEIRAAIEQLDIRHGKETLGRITGSIGVAGFPEHGQESADLVKAADKALYRAKKEGRNRIEMAEALAEGDASQHD